MYESNPCIKTCFNCKHLSEKTYSSTLYEEGGYEWGCRHPQESSFPVVETEAEDDKQMGQDYAKNCPGYEFFNWNDYYANQYEGEEVNCNPTPEEIDAMIAAGELAEQQRMKSLGWLDENGEPTPEYLTMADFSYDCYREKRLTSR